MKKLFTLLLLIGFSFSYSQSSFCDGWEKGYQQGLNSCIKVGVTPVCPPAPVTGESYGDGYGLGYAKAREKCNQSSNLSENSFQDSKIEISPTPSYNSGAYANPKIYLPETYNYGNFADAFNNAFNQSIQNAANLEAARVQRQQAMIAAEERRVKYEQAAVKNPYTDFQRGYYQTLKKIKIGKNRYDITYFRPESWQFAEKKESNQNANNNSFNVFLSRELSDGTSLRTWIYIFSIDEVRSFFKVNSPGEGIKNMKSTYENVNKLQLGYGYDINIRNKNGNLIITEIVPESAFADAGMKKGDVLISIDNVDTKEFDGNNDVLKGKKYGDMVNVVAERDGVIVEGPIMPKIRDGFFKGDINISGYPGYFIANKFEGELYGEKQHYLFITNYVALGPNMLSVLIEIKPNTTDGNLDFEFQRFKNSIMTILNNIKIN